MKRERQDTQGMAMGQKTVLDGDPEREKAKKKLDLSAAQVAGSSLATVAAALLASQMGVYGTILGAGVVSVVATAGGPLIQHFFRRTGDQLRESARPKARQVPVDAPASGEEPGTPSDAESGEEFGETTVHGTRMRGWKRTAVASGAAFALAIGALGTYEAVAGTSVSSDGRTLLTGGAGTARDHKPDPPAQPPGASTGTGGKGGTTPGPGTSPDPSGSPGGGAGPTPHPSTSPSGRPSPSATPTPPVRPSPSLTPGTGPSHSADPGDRTPSDAPATP